MKAAPAHVLGRPVITAPGAEDHKYSRGYVAVVGGSMTGAAALSAIAAARGGAGYVLVLTGEVIAMLPHAIVQRATTQASELKAALSDARLSAVLVGPGLGRDALARERLDAALDAGISLVIDGDALSIMEATDFARLPEHTILTPHEGEFVRLFGTLDGSKLDRARAAAKRSGAVVVYKGADTVIAAPDGRLAVTNDGSPWLSTAGTGDVLAGLCAARLAAGNGDTFTAACAAVWLHAEASNRAGVAFIADDLLDQIAPAMAMALA